MKMDHKCGDCRSHGARQNTQRHAAKHPDEEFLLTNMGAHGRQGGQGEGLERAEPE